MATSASVALHTALYKSDYYYYYYLKSAMSVNAYRTHLSNSIPI